MKTKHSVGFGIAVLLITVLVSTMLTITLAGCGSAEEGGSGTVSYSSFVDVP